VVAIIAVLASITIPVVSGVRRRQKAKTTKLLITQLGIALEAYAADFGDFPPSSPKLCGLPSNGTNDGIECLVRCLSTKLKKGPYFDFPEDTLRNVDEDKLVTGNPTNSYITTRELFEVVDGFGTPLIYIHNADYDKTFKYSPSPEIEGAEAIIARGL